MPKGAINITDRTWLISEEITNLNDKENIFEMSYESRALDTDTLDAPPGHVITGNKASLISECVIIMPFFHTTISKSSYRICPLCNDQQTHATGIVQWPILPYCCMSRTVSMELSICHSLDKW